MLCGGFTGYALRLFLAAFTLTMILPSFGKGIFAPPAFAQLTNLDCEHEDWEHEDWGHEDWEHEDWVLDGCLRDEPVLWFWVYKDKKSQEWKNATVVYDKDGRQIRDPRHYEIFAGADVAQSVWLVYAGSTIAPFSDIHEDGLRLRFTGGYGQYKYFSRSSNPPFQNQQFRAATYFQDALIGYLKRMGPLTAKAFVGVAQIEHQILPFDNANAVQGPDFGAKGAIELWLNLGDTGWASLDLSWAQAHNTRSARTRIGYRVMPAVSVGLEAAINVDAQADFKINDEVVAHRTTAFDYARIGGFIRSDWYGGEVSASAGLLGDFTHNNSPYITVNWIKQF